MPCGRTLSTQLPIRSSILTRLVSTTTTSRVLRLQSLSSTSKTSSIGPNGASTTLRSARGYATAAAKPASKPKAHTGRTTVKRTTKTTATKPKAKPKTAKKPKAKKPKAKPKPKPKKVKRAPSANAIKTEARQKRVALKDRAALHTEPKTLPESAWQLFVQQNASKGENVTRAIAGISANFKRLSPEERETFNHTANENKAKNEADFQRWVRSFTPLQVKDINNARLQLLREAKAKKVKRLQPYRPLKDDRLVKSRQSAYTFFFAERMASGDLKGMSVGDAARLIGSEWKALSAAEKKPFNEKADADLVRYQKEYKATYGVETQSETLATKRLAAASKA